MYDAGYGLVAESTGRDDGVGRLANRWIECALDACRFVAKSKNGIVNDHLLAPVLNTASGVNTYLTAYYDATPVKVERIRIEHEMVKELLMEVDGCEVEEVAKRFRKGLMKRDLDGITDWLAQDIDDYRKKYPDQFRNLSSRDRRYFPLQDFRTVLRRKLRQLFQHLPDSPPTTVGNIRRKGVAKKRNVKTMSAHFKV